MNIRPMSEKLNSFSIPIVLFLIFVMLPNCVENKVEKYKYTNKLIHETSPYLLQHAHNPVNWYPWGDEALKLAKKENKPIFLSIGYSACHWCHVMEEESFENEPIAELMNAHFVCIKVDREERPDLDEIYMTAVQVMTGSGGWPLSVWLTPELEPFYGGTYFPPEDRWGRTGFPNVLQQLADLWQNQPGKILQSGGQLKDYLRQINQVQSSESEVNMDVWHTAFREAQSRFDEKFGGFGNAPKFPQAMELSFLLRYYFHTGKKDALNIVEKSLRAMAMGGIYDQLGGGFHRYATDAKWLVPHFEKMLYDNALLAKTYLEAYQLTGENYYANIARETLNYVLREMTSPEGVFYSSQDADSEGEEGKFYVWQSDEIENLLGPHHSNVFDEYFGVTAQGNWEGKNILHVSIEERDILHKYQLDSREFMELVTKSKHKLLRIRDKRIAPATDDKILTSWNGLMISAMCKGFQVLRDEKYLDSAKKAVAFLIDKMYIESNLLRTYRNSKSHLSGYLSDYANFVAALLDMYESSFELEYLKKAIELNNLTLQKFWDENTGGFFFTPSGHEHLIVRTRNPYDNAVPGGNSVAVHNLFRLSEFTDDNSLKEKAAKTTKLFTAQMKKSPSAFSYLLSSLDYLWGTPKQIVISGEKKSKPVAEMVASIHSKFLPNKVLALTEPKGGDDELLNLPLFIGKSAQSSTAKIYVCENYACQSPFNSTEEFEKYYQELIK